MCTIGSGPPNHEYRCIGLFGTHRKRSGPTQIGTHCARSSGEKRLLKQPGTPEDIAAVAQELHDGGQHKLALLLIDVGLNHAPSNGTLRRVKGDICGYKELGLASEWWVPAQASDSIAQETVKNISALTPRTITASVWAP